MKCKYCGTGMAKREERKIGNMGYSMYYCPSCNKTVAKAKE